MKERKRLAQLEEALELKSMILAFLESVDSQLVFEDLQRDLRNVEQEIEELSC